MRNTFINSFICEQNVKLRNTVIEITHVYNCTQIYRDTRRSEIIRNRYEK